MAKVNSSRVITGIFRGRRLPVAIVPVVLTAAACFGCSSAARYARGPLPDSALPVPSFGIVSPRQMASATASETSSRIAGRLKSVKAAGGTEPGIVFNLTDVDSGTGETAKEAVFRVATGDTTVPFMVAGDEVIITILKSRYTELVITDSFGTVLRAWIGEGFPATAEDFAVNLAALADTAYTEVVQSEDLCRQTWLHPFILFSSDVASASLAPGRKAAIPGSWNGRMWSWLVTTADERVMDESTCAEDRPTRSFFVWIRTGHGDSGFDSGFEGIRKLND